MKRLWWRVRLAIEWLRERTPWKHKTNLTKERPPGWEQSNVGPFWELMWSNVIATFANTELSKKIIGIDALMNHFVQNASRVKGKGSVEVGMPLLLAIRAHSAFRFSACLGFSGAAPETMAVLRLCLETTGYASMMQGDQDVSMIWVQRTDTEDTRQTARNTFTHGKVRRSLETKNKEIAGHYVAIYERLIESGAHPNELGVMRSLLVEQRKDGGARLTQMYLTDDPRRIEMVQRAIGQVGVCVLMLLEMMYPDEFEKLGISPHMPDIAKGL
jgi:hypothetical protein